MSGGFEWETQTFIRGHFEVGYVFDREVVFESGDPPPFKPDDTFMIRGGSRLLSHVQTLSRQAKVRCRPRDWATPMRLLA